MREERGARAHSQGPRVKSMEVGDGKWVAGGIAMGVGFLLLLTYIYIIIYIMFFLKCHE